MIEINLLPGKKKRAAPGAGFRFALPDFRGLIATIRNPWLIAASATSAVVIVGAVLLFFTQTARLRVAQARLDAGRVEERRVGAAIPAESQTGRVRHPPPPGGNNNPGADPAHHVLAPTPGHQPQT